MRRLLLAGLGAVTLACAHGGDADIATLASNSDQLIYDAAQKAIANRNFDSAKQYLKRLVEGFPQSNLGAEARLSLADVYFKEGGAANYILAISSYRDFLTLYPSHPRSGYAQFQVAEAFYKQKNAADRDQSQTEKALDEYQKLLEIHGGSEYEETARSRIADCRQSLARADFVAGYFYQRTRQAYRSAVLRYQHLLNEYPDYQRIDEVLYRLAESLVKSGRVAEARPQLARLLEEYNRSPFADDARHLMERIDSGKPLSKPAPRPRQGQKLTPAAPASPPPPPSPDPQAPAPPTPTPAPSASPSPPAVS